MQASSWQRWIVMGLAIGTLACARNPAPGAWLGTAAEMQNDPYGAWIVVSADSVETFGEFLAVDRDSVFVLGQDVTVRTVPLSRVTHAELAFFDARWSDLALWTGLGALSTISNGVILVLTFPTWIIGGTIATAAESRAPLRTVNRIEDWDSVRMFARFPGGLPENLPRRLPTKPVH